MTDSPGKSGAPAWRMIRITGVTAVALLCAVALANFIVDPMGYYPTHLFRQLTWSSRTAKVDLMKSAAGGPDILVLGSSRTMLIAPEDIANITRKKAFNASVDSARVEDYLAILRFAYEGLGWRPSEILLGIDLEAFHNNLEPDVRLLTNAELRRYLPLDMRLRGWGVVLGSLLSSQGIAMGARSIWYSFKGYPEDVFSIDPDGLMHYVKEEKAIGAGTFKPDIRASIPEYEGRFGGYTELDPRRKEMLESLISYVRERGITVRCFMTPLHPALLEHLNRTRGFSALHDEASAYLSGLAKDSVLFKFTDLTEPSSFGGRPDMFYDGAHMRRENTIRLLWKMYPGETGG